MPWASMQADYLDVFSSCDREGDGEALALRATGPAPDEQHLVAAVGRAELGAERSAGEADGQRQRRFGRGRHGGLTERRLLAHFMVARRQAKRRAKHTQEQARVLKDFSQRIVLPSLSRKRPRLPVLEVCVAGRTRAARRTGGSGPKRVVAQSNRLRLIFRDPGGKREIAPVATMLDCAFDGLVTRRAVSSKFGLSPRSVGRCCVAVSCAYLHTQDRMLEQMALAFSRAPPTFLVRRGMKQGRAWGSSAISWEARGHRPRR